MRNIGDFWPFLNSIEPEVIFINLKMIINDANREPVILLIIFIDFYIHLISVNFRFEISLTEMPNI